MQLKERTSYYFKRHCVGYWKQAQMPECRRIKYTLHTLQRTSNCRICPEQRYSRKVASLAHHRSGCLRGLLTRGDPTWAAVATP